MFWHLALSVTESPEMLTPTLSIMNIGSFFCSIRVHLFIRITQVKAPDLNFLTTQPPFQSHWRHFTAVFVRREILPLINSEIWVPLEMSLHNFAQPFNESVTCRNVFSLVLCKIGMCCTDTQGRCSSGWHSI